MSYTPTTWNTGDVITAEKLNNLEGGVEKATPFVVKISYDDNSDSYSIDSTYDEIAQKLFGNNHDEFNPDAVVLEYNECIYKYDYSYSFALDGNLRFKSTFFDYADDDCIYVIYYDIKKISGEDVVEYGETNNRYVSPVSIDNVPQEEGNYKPYLYVDQYGGNIVWESASDSSDVSGDIITLYVHYNTTNGFTLNPQYSLDDLAATDKRILITSFNGDASNASNIRIFTTVEAYCNSITDWNLMFEGYCIADYNGNDYFGMLSCIVGRTAQNNICGFYPISQMINTN